MRRLPGLLVAALLGAGCATSVPEGWEQLSLVGHEPYWAWVVYLGPEQRPHYARDRYDCELDRAILSEVGTRVSACYEMM